MSAITRRQALGGLAAALAAPALAADGGLKLATFVAEVTIPPGHPCMGGGIAPAAKIDDPLEALGLVLIGSGKPVVLCAVDWCEIRTDAHDRWRAALAEAAGTDPERVLVSSVHQHDAPVADLTAQRLLDEARAGARVCDPEFHEKAVGRVARALRDGLKSAKPVTHVGTGRANVEQIASNRRYPGPDGTPRFDRTSATRDPAVRAAPEGTVDPFLKALSFWDGEKPLAAVSCYATHPMSYYGKGGVSADFVGMARRRRQADEKGVFQIYLSGCSGNVTAGKYNDGSPDNRPRLADRLYRAMAEAWRATERRPLATVGFRSVPLKLEPRGGEEFSEEGLKRRLTGDPKPFGRCLAALGLSWRERSGRPIDLPVVELGGARLLLLPAEAYVEYQLLAQKRRPELFVMTAGYGECGPGYVPVERAWAENDGNLRDWCWVAPGAEKALTAALATALGRPG
jgi:hypothetical protein